MTKIYICRVFPYRIGRSRCATTTHNPITIQVPSVHEYGKTESRNRNIVFGTIPYSYMYIAQLNVD